MIDFQMEFSKACAEIERLQAERDLWEARCIAAVWLIPADKTCGELQDVAKRASELLAANPK